MKYIPFLTKLFTAAFVILIGYVILAQTILVPRAIANNYDQRLKPELMALREQFIALSKTAEEPVYNDPYSDLTTARTDLLANQKLIADTETALSNYEREAGMLQDTAFAPYSPTFKKAEVKQDRSANIFFQSREVIANYKQLNEYLLQVNTMRSVFENSTFDINSLTDLNVLIGQSDVLSGRAAGLRTALETFKKANPPADYESYHNTLITSVQQAINGLDQPAIGALTTSDVHINNGASILEQAIQKYEAADSLAFINASAASPILKETAELADKVESLEPFLTQ